MLQLTLLELLQCVFWAVLGLSPTLLGYIVGFDDGQEAAKGVYKQSGLRFLMFCFGIVVSAAGLICAFKAGGK